MNEQRTIEERLVLLLAVLLLAGCAEAPENTADGIRVTGFSSEGYVQEIRLKDGTRCVVLIGYNKGAIACDWAHHE